MTAHAAALEPLPHGSLDENEICGFSGDARRQAGDSTGSSARRPPYVRGHEGSESPALDLHGLRRADRALPRPGRLAALPRLPGREGTAPRRPRRAARPPPALGELRRLPPAPPARGGRARPAPPLPVPPIPP